MEVFYFSGNSWQLDAPRYNSSSREFLSPQTWAYDNCFRCGAVCGEVWSVGVGWMHKFPWVGGTYRYAQGTEVNLCGKRRAGVHFRSPKALPQLPRDFLPV